MNTEIHKHSATTVDNDKNALICLECKQVVMPLNHFQELQELNKEFFDGVIDQETYHERVKTLKEKIDNEKTTL